jgi:hypothetical protein
MTDKPAFPNPLDTPLSAGLRFAMELIAWIAGPWAVGQWLGPWAAALALLILVAAPAIFSTPGDKHQVIVPVPGVVRFTLEVDLATAGVVAAWFAWPRWAAAVATVVAVGAQVTGWRRSRWLLQGAPSLDS